MTTGDDQQWAPQGGESSPNEPAAPVDRDPWAPAGGETPPPFLVVQAQHEFVKINKFQV